jgi:recombinational DNA repair ATPase RecF
MTLPPQIKSLHIAAFRGSTETFDLPFEKRRKLTLIYGENGAGKTTICDAFEFLADEKVSSLADCGLGGGLTKYWPTIGKGTADLSVTLKTSEGSCTAKFFGKTVRADTPALRPKIEILRRQQILALVNALPSDRYDEIRRFIDIDGFIKSEDALRLQIKELNDSKKNADQIVSQNLQMLKDLYSAAGSPPVTDAMAWARQKLVEATTDYSEDIAALDKLRFAYEALRPYSGRVKARRKETEDAEAASAVAASELAAAAEAVVAGTADTLVLLEAGEAYLHKHPEATECPLCRSRENIKGLSGDVVARLSLLGSLKAATTKQQQCAATLATAKGAEKQIEIDYADAQAAYLTAKDSHAWPSDVKQPIDLPPTDVFLLDEWLKANDAIALTWSAIGDAWRDAKNSIDLLKAAIKRYDQNLAESKKLAALITVMDVALAICVEQRKVFVDGILGGIATEVGTLYEDVHPGEGMEKIALSLDPDKRASLELAAQFEGKDVPPQAYFSQSHLDTLGLCVFLALAKREVPGEKILILDDVLSSVDEPHVDRIVTLLYAESERFRHTIITTHYRRWRERFRWGVLNPGKDCQFVELDKWTKARGLSVVGCIPELDLLKALLAGTPPDTQSIASKAGVCLEYALDFLTLLYGCRVPRKREAAYTLGELLDAIGDKLGNALKVEIRDGLTGANSPPTKVILLKPILEEIRRTKGARNVLGAHFNDTGSDMLDQDRVVFAKQVVQLVEALCHPEDGWPTKDNSGSYWQNSGDSRRLFPLKKPH